MKKRVGARATRGAPTQTKIVRVRVMMIMRGALKRATRRVTTTATTSRVHLNWLRALLANLKKGNGENKKRENIASRVGCRRVG